MRRTIWILLILGALTVFSDAHEGIAQDEEIRWFVISSGSVRSTSAQFIVRETVGQPTLGATSTSDSFSVEHGYWPAADDGGSHYIMGDANGSGNVDIDDVVFLISYIFAGGPPPSPLASGDCDCSTNVDIDDVVYLITYIFAGGPAPGDPDGNGTPDC